MDSYKLWTYFLYVLNNVIAIFVIASVAPIKS